MLTQYRTITGLHFVAIGAILSAAAGCLQAQPQGRPLEPPGLRCSIEGTWYGGQDNGAKYLATITKLRENVYSVLYHEAFRPKVPALTPYSGKIFLEKDATYLAYVIAMANLSDVPPGPGSAADTPEVWAVRSHSYLSDCDTLNSEIDFFAAYYWLSNKVPFRDPPDYYRALPGMLIRETYHRMPTVCDQCPPRD